MIASRRPAAPSCRPKPVCDAARGSVLSAIGLLAAASLFIGACERVDIPEGLDTTGPVKSPIANNSAPAAEDTSPAQPLASTNAAGPRLSETVATVTAHARDAGVDAASETATTGAGLEPGATAEPTGATVTAPNTQTGDEALPAWPATVHAIAKAQRKGGPLHERAVMPDRAYASTSAIAVRRLVYRVHFLVPKTFRENRTLVRAPAGELTLDVSNDRLRARFSGPAWPVPEGAEVRLRRDALGVYMFDGRGGRQLSPGQLALWFEGRGTPGVQSTVRVRRETGKIAPGPGELVCALLAEWGGQPRDAVLRRCSHGALPPWFAFGPWRAELTAVVPMELPASQMRADEVDPPVIATAPALRPVLATSELGQITPLRPINNDGDAQGPAPIAKAPPTTAAPAGRTLHITNQTDSRALVCVAGVPVAWVDGHSEGSIEGLVPGRHMIGALRPFGGLALTRRPVETPGTLIIRSHAQ